MLRHQIKRLTQAGTIKSRTKAAGPDYSHLKQMYRLLAIEAFVVVGLALLYIGLALWIAIDRHSVSVVLPRITSRLMSELGFDEWL